MFNLDWQAIFAPSVPVLEIFVRGTVVYLVLFALLRFTFFLLEVNSQNTNLMLILFTTHTGRKTDRLTEGNGRFRLRERPAGQENQPQEQAAEEEKKEKQHSYPPGVS